MHRIRHHFTKLSVVLVVALTVGVLAVPAFASVLLDGDFEPDLSPFRYQPQGTGNTGSLVTSPACDGNAVKLTLGTGSGTHRMQLDGAPNNESRGGTYYTGWATYIPTDYPTVTSFHVFMQWFASPHNGSPPIGLGINAANDSGGQGFELVRNKDGNYRQIWSTPTIKGRWVDFVMARKVSTSETEGYIEFWVDGVKQTFINGAQRYYMRTDNTDSTQPLRTIPTHYSGVGNGGTLYHDEIRTATTMAEVVTNCRPGATPTPTPTPTPPPDSTPVADFTIAPNPAAPGENVTFDATATGGDGTLTYKWEDVGCSTPCALGTGDPLTRSFANEGTKYVLLTVTDADGDTATARHDLVVEEPAPVDTVPSNVDFTFTPENPIAPNQDVTFTASHTGGNGPFAYRWEDDGPDGPGGTQYLLATTSTNTYTRSFANGGTATAPALKHIRVTVSEVDKPVDTATTVHDHARHDVEVVQP